MHQLADKRARPAGAQSPDQRPASLARAARQVCSANMATEQEAEKASGDRAALDDALNKLAALSGVGAERERLTQQLQHYALLKQKYAQKSTALKEVRERLWAAARACSMLRTLAGPG